MQTFTRHCPICSKEINYTSKSSFERMLGRPCINCKDDRKNTVLSLKEIQAFKLMIEQGYFKKDIIKEFKLTDDQYRYIIRRNKFRTNKETSIKIIDKDNKLAQCSECNEIKTLEDNFFFKVKKNGYKYFYTYCDDCKYKKKCAKMNSNVDYIISDRWYHIKQAAPKKNTIFDISKEDFIEQYKNQNGLCFYTDLPMVCLWGYGKQRNAMSVDKIIPTLGYVKGNIVFCLNRINMAKHDFALEEIKLWMPDWYQRITKFLNETNEF